MKKTLRNVASVWLGALGITFAALGQAAPLSFSFSGTFSQDDEVRLINFTADGSSNVLLVSYGYGGGTQANGTTFSGGGFDTILALFDSSGTFIGQNDDGDLSCFASAAAAAPGTINAQMDPHTHAIWDTCYSASLAAGSYTVAVMQYYNFANGPSLSDGFWQDGTGNFTASNNSCTQGSFCDVSTIPVYTNRTNVWAYDVLNVAAAAVVPGPNSTVPEPGSLLLVGLSMGILAMARRKIANRPAN